MYELQGMKMPCNFFIYNLSQFPSVIVGIAPLLKYILNVCL